MRDKILRGGTAVLFRQFLSLPVNALGVIAASSLLKPSDYGVQAVVLPVAAFGMLIADLGTSQALIQSKFYLSKSLTNRLQWFKAGCAVFTVMLLALLSPSLVRLFGLHGISPLLFPACALLGWLQSQRAYKAVLLQRSLEWSKLARLEMAEIVIYNILLVILAYIMRSAWCFVLALAVRNGVGVALLTISTRKTVIEEAEKGGSITSLLRFGIPWQLTILFSLVLNSANPIIVGHLLGLSVVGVVSWSATMVALPQLPFQPLPSFLFSVLSARKREHKDDRVIIADIAYAGTLLLCLVSLVFMLLLDSLVQYVFGSQWVAAIPVASILLISNAAFCPSLIISAHLNSNGHSQAWLLLTILKTFLIWGSVAIGTTLWGAQGYAVAFVVASLLILVAESITARVLVGTEVSWTSPIHFALLMGLAWAACQLVRGILADGQAVNVLVGFLTGISVFLLLLWATNHNSLRRICLSGAKLLPEGGLRWLYSGRL